MCALVGCSAGAERLEQGRAAGAGGGWPDGPRSRDGLAQVGTDAHPVPACRRPELQPMRVHCGKVETLFDSLGGVEDAPAPSSSSAASAAASSSSSVQSAAPPNDPRAGGLAAAYLDPGCQPCALERLVVHALRSRAFREGAVVAFQPSLAHLPPRLQAKALLQLEEEVVAVAKQSGYSADRLVRVTQAPTYVLHLGSWRQPPPAPARPAAAGAAAAAAPGAAAAGAAGPTKRRSSPGSPPQQLERRRESSFLLPNRLTEAAWAPSLGLLGAEGLHKGPPARRRLPGQYDTRR